MNRISACLIVRNEEKRIEGCLKSLVGVVDEIVVVHDGTCLDKTEEICLKYGAQFFTRALIGNCDPHVPFALSHCAYEWALFIDADERLSEGLKNTVGKLVDSSEFDAFYFNWAYEIAGKRYGFLKKQILFRKNKMYSVGLPHVSCEVRGKSTYYDLDLIHDTNEFNNANALLKKYIEKDYAWAQVTANLLSGPLDKISVYNCQFPSENTKQSKKLMLVREHPFIAMCIVPPYSFLNSYIRSGGIRHGYLGFVLSCHTPLHAFFTCYFLLQKRYSKI